MYCKGFGLYNLGRHEEAVRFIDDALKLDPQFAPALNYKGLSLAGPGPPRGGRLLLRQGAGTQPASRRGPEQQGRQPRRLGRHAEAIRCFDKALELDAEGGDGLVSKRSQPCPAGAPRRGHPYIREGLGAQPSKAAFTGTKARRLACLGRHEEAVQLL